MTDAPGLVPDSTNAIVWRGMAMPLYRSNRGYFSSKGIVDLAWSSIIMILTTPRHFRVMLPEFGAGLYEEIFEQIDIAAVHIREALNTEVGKWDTRIVGVESDVRVVDQTSISVFARFRVRGYPDTIDKQITLGRQSFLGG